MLSVDHIMHHHFIRMDVKTFRILVFVWEGKGPSYCPVAYDFFILQDGRLWPFTASFAFQDGYHTCMQADIDGMFRDMIYAPVYPDRHFEYDHCERRIIETI